MPFPFPANPVIETFTGAGQTPPNANWTNLIYSTDGNVSQDGAGLAALNSGSRAGAYWNPGQFGPDAEAYVDIVTEPGAGNYTAVHARVKNPGTTSVVGYAVEAWTGTPNNFTIVRHGDQLASEVTLSTIAVAHAAGDGFGIKIVGDYIEAWYRPGASGAWRVIGAVHDAAAAAISDVGYIGIAGFASTWRLDNFGGGLLPQPQRMKWLAPGPIRTFPRALRFSDKFNNYLDPYPTVVPATPVSDSDSNGTTDEIATLVAQITQAEANGTPVETAVLLAIATALDVNGAVSDVASLVALISPPADAGGATTETTLLNIKPAAETNTTAEAIILTAAIPAPETGTSVETPSEVFATTQTDADGTITEVANVTVPVSATDVDGTITEVATVTVPINGTDTNGATTEIATPNKQTADSGSETEAQVLSAVYTSSDADGATTEVGSIKLVGGDQNSTLESASVLVQLTGLDAGSDSETAGLVAQYALPDLGTSTEVAVLIAKPIVSDAGGDVELADPRVVYTVVDAAAGVELMTRLGFLASDLGLGSGEQVVALARFSSQEAGIGSDSGSLHVDTVNSWPEIETGDVSKTKLGAIPRNQSGRVL